MTIRRIGIFLTPEDRSPSRWMRRKPWLLVRIETADGIAGWGECYTLTRRERSMAALVRALGETLLGKDESAIRAFAQGAWRGLGESRAGIDFYAAVSGIELALWDIAGKARGTPVHRLLGGAVREHVPVYANIWRESPSGADELARKAAQMVAAGYRAIKMYPTLRCSGEAEAVARVKAVREAVGADVAIAIDLWRGLEPEEAIRLARALEPYDLAWVEDPITTESPAVLARLASRIRQPVLVGETLAGRHAFAPLIAEESAAYLNPDIAACGGLLEVLAIASIAETRHVLISPHNYNSMCVGFAASVTAASLIPNLLSLEHFPDLAEDNALIGAAQPTIAGGMAPVSCAPGLGIEISDTQAARFLVDEIA